VITGVQMGEMSKAGLTDQMVYQRHVFGSYVHIMLVKVVTLHCNLLDVHQHVRGTLFSWRVLACVPWYCSHQCSCYTSPR
jgi:hypothetical protein